MKKGPNRLTEDCKGETVGDQQYRHRIRAESQSHAHSNKPLTVWDGDCFWVGAGWKRLRVGTKPNSCCFTYCSIRELEHLLGEDRESQQSNFCFPTYKQSICMPRILIQNHLIHEQRGSGAGSQRGCFPSGGRIDFMTEIKFSEATESLHLNFRFMFTLQQVSV